MVPPTENFQGLVDPRAVFEAAESRVQPRFKPEKPNIATAGQDVVMHEHFAQMFHGVCRR
ncbi:hypothetical protein [Paeniglutamicibacter kerguelensis]|uniref:Uncharacterized protein n=1 Tax=Paeniglutamicibacter kerguelensis TaxID=254788 RepID=A0ABS4XBV3_9MICC|nr:hypothetical protein [Paeniglutamicibacter kerguelensis]MBP2385952.1 hypothetical protein [Paeniglutamicibacter kerguelensis]